MRSIVSFALVSLFVVACSDATDPADDGTTASSTDDGADASDPGNGGATTPEDAGDGLEISGDYTYDAGEMLFSADQFTVVYEEDGMSRTLTFTVSLIDNDAQFVIGEGVSTNPDDFAGAWARVDWVWVGSDLYVCNMDVEESEAESLAIPRPDDSDPANGGCAIYAWDLLTPQ